MNKEAIEQIQKSAGIPQIMKALEEMGTKTPCIVTPEDFKITNLESYMENRSSFRLNMQTDSLADFISYSKKFEEIGATCFINAESMKAKTVFDLGTTSTPGHQEHTTILSLKKTAAYKAILDINGKTLSQKEASDFIEDWIEQITVYSNEGTVIQNSVASKLLRDLTIERASEINSKVHDFGESMSAMEKIEAKNKDLLPNKLQFICTPYLGLNVRNFTIKLSVLTGDSKPRISFRIIQLETKQEQIVNEFKDELVDAFESNDIETYIGTI